MDDLQLPNDCVIHSLRHTFLTRFSEAGADAFTIKKVAGHSSVTISERYIHPTPEGQERAFERFANLNREAVEKTETTGVATVQSRPLVSHCAPVAQRLEQQTHNLLVRGSNPCGGTKSTGGFSYTYVFVLLGQELINLTMARRWRDLAGATIALLPWKPHDLTKCGVGQSINCMTKIQWRLMSVNTRHSH